MSENPPKSEKNRLLDAALFYARIGWSVIPCEPRGKKPLVAWEPAQKFRAQEGLVRRWWAEHPTANVGVVTGLVSGIVVLDVDGEEGAKSLEQFPDLDPTPAARTGKGLHYYFRHPGEGHIPNRTAIAPGLDFRGDGGYVIAPPSVHPSGIEYTWIVPPNRQPPVHPPDLGPGNGRPAPTSPIPERIPEGQRHARLLSLAGSMRRRGASDTAILAALRAVNSEKCAPPLQDPELVTLSRSMMRYPPAQADAGNGEEPAPNTDRHHLTDVGNGKRLVERHGRDIRYCHAWGKWLVWDGRRWEVDATEEITRRGKETGKDIYFEAASEEDEDRRKALAKHATRTENEARLRAMISMAASENGVPVRTEYLDPDPWLLTVENGTIDLHTGALREHRREDMITKLAPVRFDPDAQCPEWEKFLARVFDGRTNLIDFVQKATGYSLTGDTSEQCLFLLYGTGQNGKTKFLEAISAIMGDYATLTPTDALMAKREAGIPHDIARLKGARMVWAVEAEEGKRLAEVLIKQMTGGDRMVARFLHHEFFEFQPTFKLFLAANHKPVVRGTDHAIWRRIRLIPFTVTIPEQERDRNIFEKFKKELPGILNWALSGCLAWKKDGFDPPDEVKNATSEYRSEMDVLGEFISELCVLDRTMQSASADLYARYGEWCERNGETKISQRSFGMRLEDRGLHAFKGSGGRRCWRGIGILSGTSGA